ncbi:hypothetical protein [Tolypothrix sp. VBCCA 56010]|uniref:hypothetical protein n=1 Tax=Tolypothrix sp. VBCCA 56010 TaxID=3137731 RepID=UPI003D7EE22A
MLRASSQAQLSSGLTVYLPFQGLSGVSFLVASPALDSRNLVNARAAIAPTVKIVGFDIDSVSNNT